MSAAPAAAPACVVLASVALVVGGAVYVAAPARRRRRARSVEAGSRFGGEREARRRRDAARRARAGARRPQAGRARAARSAAPPSEDELGRSPGARRRGPLPGRLPRARAPERAVLRPAARRAPTAASLLTRRELRASRRSSPALTATIQRGRAPRPATRRRSWPPSRRAARIQRLRRTSRPSAQVDVGAAQAARDREQRERRRRAARRSAST